ncbi:MAG: hypothetical protein ABSD64_02970 [Terriglobales bacterium]
MRLACTLAIALGLSFPAAGQTPAAPTPAENPASAQVPADSTPAPEKKTAESAEKMHTESGVASGSKKHRQRTAPAPDGAPRKIVVREGGASEPAAHIAPGMTPAEAARQRQNAEQLLGSTGEQLKQLSGRALSALQQETVAQIRNYMDGARSALQQGDLRRASTLAEKAHLLADDLAKH